MVHSTKEFFVAKGRDKVVEFDRFEACTALLKNEDV